MTAEDLALVILVMVLARDIRDKVAAIVDDWSKILNGQVFLFTVLHVGLCRDVTMALADGEGFVK